MSRNTKRKSNKKTTKNDKSESRIEIYGVVFIAIGLLLSVAIYTDLAGFLSVFAQRLSRLLIGIGSYIIPIYLLY